MAVIDKQFTPQPSRNGGSSGPPTSEKGSVLQYQGILPWSLLAADDQEYVPDLKWPNSIFVYDRMQTDAQLKGLRLGVCLPVSRFRWHLVENGATSSRVKVLAQDLGVDIQGKDPLPRRRLRNRFSFGKHLWDALRAPGIYGHYPFEQVGTIGDDELWHLTKLAPRPPRTITEINVNPDGGLRSIKQAVGPSSPELDVSRLVYYDWDREGGNWAGRPMIRDCYRSWVLKDRLLRIDTMKHERGGIGVPVIEAPQGANKNQMIELNKLAQLYKVEENAGGALPYGAKLRLVGTEGTLPDTVGSIRLHNEEMARSFLMMFMQLGQTESGSRALAGEFIDYFSYSLEAVADWFRDIFNEHVIEDYWEWNYGPEDQVPYIDYEKSEEEELQAADLATLVKNNVINMDDELENAVREHYKVPKRTDKTPSHDPAKNPAPPAPPPPDPNAPETQPPETTPPGVAGARRSTGRVEAESPSPIPLPPRKLRRKPYEFEVQASVDFAQMDSAYQIDRDRLLSEVKNLRRQQVMALHDQIVAAGGNLKKLAKLSVDGVAEDVILAAMQRAADAGILQAMGEAERQGVPSATRPSSAGIEDLLASRAQATDNMLAKALAEVATRQAINRTGAEISASEVANQVRTHIENLSDSWLESQLGGAVQQGMNSGRRLVMRDNNAQEIYASEILDDHTCEECALKDGEQYTSMADAEADYPTGGYVECLGGPNCRGTLVALYNETPASVE